MIGENHIGILLSKENLALSKYEVERLYDDYDVSYTDNLALLNTDDLSEVHEKLSKSSYAKKAYDLVAHEENWDELLRSIEAAEITAYALPNETYKVDSLRIGNTHQATDRGLLAGLTNTTGSLTVNVDDPDALFVHIKGENHSYGRRIWENTEPFTKRRNDRLPEPHPTALDPRLGRAMVNIAQPDDHVLDPFAGSGGLLIEAGLLGYTARGIDHDSRMIDRARANLGAFDLPVDLTEADALNESFDDIVVTDVPYGKNSTASENVHELFASFIDKARDECKTAVVCHPNDDAFLRVIDATGAEAASFTRYENRSLTRRITVLEFS